MTKLIRKGDNMIIISLCPSCMSGELWIIRSQNSYTTVHIAHQENGDINIPLVITKTKLKTPKGWIKLPKEIMNDKKNGWTMSDFFEKPYDWHEQESLYDAQNSTYIRQKRPHIMPSALKKSPRSLPTNT
jgi:hypothetical protein